MNVERQQPADQAERIEYTRIDVLQQGRTAAERGCPEWPATGKNLCAGLKEDGPVIQQRVPLKEAATGDEQFPSEDERQQGVQDQDGDNITVVPA